MPRMIALFVTLLLSAPAAQEPVVPAEVDEFPLQDASIQSALLRAEYRAEAAERLRRAPDEIETLRALARTDNLDGLLQSLRLIIDSHPRRIAAAIESIQDVLYRFRGSDEQALRRADALRQIAADAKRHLTALPREEAARTARALLTVDSALARAREQWLEELREFVERYRGTETALLAQVDLITAGPLSSRTFDELDAFIASNPGTVAAAKALYQKGFHWHTINTLRFEGRGADPLPRFERVQAVVRELQSGRYPESEWTEKSRRLIPGFFIPSDARIPDDSLTRLIQAFEDHARANFDPLPTAGGEGVAYVITSKLPDLYARRGDREEQLERFLATLQRDGFDRAAVHYLRGSSYMRVLDRESPEARHARLQKARVAFRAAAEGGGSITSRRALATLASIDFGEGEYAAAGETFRRYLDAYPGTRWSWVAALRIGQCEEALGREVEALAAFRRAAQAYGEVPLARVLAHVYAGRVLEATGEIGEAREEYRRALDGWDNLYGQSYSTHVRRSSNPADPFVRAPDAGEVTKAWLIARTPQLTQALKVPGGSLLEHGRGLLSRGSCAAAADVLDRFLAEYPKSPLVPEGRYLAHLARLEQALELANVEGAGTDPAKAEQILERLTREPHDFAVTAAKVMRATMRWMRGDDVAAEDEALREALAEWQAKQSLREASDSLEADVAAIRRQVFLPRGGKIYQGERWNAFRWSEASTPFLIVNADVRVKEHDGEIRRVRLPQRLSDIPQVLFLDTEQIALLKKIIVSLGGTKRREPGHVMETPNQPVGGAHQIVTLWKRFFPARPGHWGGWELETYPVITEIHFTNAERTKASARVTIGYSGGTVELEKEHGGWVAKRLVNQWIT